MKTFLPVVLIHLFSVFALLLFHPYEVVKKKQTRIKVHHAPFTASENTPKEIPLPLPIVDVKEPVVEIAPLPEPEIVEIPKETPPEPTPVVKEIVKETPKKPVVKDKPPLIKEVAKQEVPKKTSPPVKPLPKKETTPKKPEIVLKKPTTTPPKKSAASPKQPNRDRLYAMMQESLENLGSTKSSKNVPQSKNSTLTDLPKLASEALKFEASYQDSLVLLLEERLEFPEKGNVKIKLTLKKDGTIQNVELVSVKSEKNAKYLEVAIKNIQFPPLQKFFPKEDVHTFFITLTSEKTR